MIASLTLNALKQSPTKSGPEQTPKRQTRTSLLALSLDGHRLEGVLVRKLNGSLRVQSTVGASLQLNLLTDAPELVGREIRNHLDKAGIRERSCTVCIPLEWALTLHISLPDLPPEDVESFLNIEAERGFPFPQETLAMVTSRCRAATGPALASVVAVPKDHLATLQKVLKAAQLKPLSFSFGMTSLEDPSRSKTEGVAALAIGENSVELEVACGGGIAALRTLQGALEQDGVRKKPYVDVVARDLRITLGQLPAELRDSVRRLRVFGSGEELSRFAEELAARTKPMGLQLELVQEYASEDLAGQTAPGASVSPALSLAARVLTGRGSEFEFLPPKVSPWKQLTNRYSSAKLVWTGVAAGAVLLLVIGALLVQQWQLSRWRSRWDSIRPRVTEVENMQQQIRRYRPWFDDSFRSLSILRKVTEAFPEDGSVSAKTVEIRDPGTVSCSGTARDQQALLNVVKRLSATKEIKEAHVEQVRGKQFTINLHWGGSGQ